MDNLTPRAQRVLHLARKEAEQLAGERDVLTGERDTLRERVAALETESARYKSEYDLLSASTTRCSSGPSGTSGPAATSPCSPPPWIRSRSSASTMAFF